MPNTLLSQYKTDGTDKEAFFFRTTVTVDDPAEIKAITGSIIYDDAAIVYLNGQRIDAFDEFLHRKPGKQAGGTK